MAWATGCWLWAASARAAARVRAASPAQTSWAARAGWPRVRVPVLSKAMARRRRAASRCTPPLMSRPKRAARARALTRVTGVAMTSAQGQAMTSSASARYSACGHGHGQGENGRGVGGGEAVDEGLRGGALALRLLHGVDDAGQLRVLRGGAHAHGEQAAFVERAGVNGVARLFVHGQAFAGDGGLVDGAVAFDDLAVERQPLAGAHAHERAHGHLGGGGFAPLPVLALHQRLRRGHVHQAGDGVAGALHGQVFQPLGQGVERHHHGRFGPLADGKSAGDGRGHEGVDAQAPAPHGGQPACVGAQAGDGHGHGGQQHAGRLAPAACAGGREGVPQLRAQRQGQRQGHARVARIAQQTGPARCQRASALRRGRVGVAVAVAAVAGVVAAAVQGRALGGMGGGAFGVHAGD